MRFFVFVDVPYYPYVADVIEANSLDEARAIAAEGLRPGDETVLYLAPAESVASVRMEGPAPEPRGLLRLMRDSNRYHAAKIAFVNQWVTERTGGFSVRVEPGSLE